MKANSPRGLHSHVMLGIYGIENGDYSCKDKVESCSSNPT